MAKAAKTATTTTGKAAAPVRLSVPVMPQTHQSFAMQCVDLDMSMGARLQQLLRHEMQGDIKLELTAKKSNKADTHTKYIPASLPKPFHKELRKYCLQRSLLMADHAERLILWDLEKKGKALEPEE